MSDLDSRLVRYSTGRKNLGKVKNQTDSWVVFRNKFKVVPRSGETLREYGKLTELEQRDKKSSEGFWFRSATVGEVRRRDTAKPSDLITLDFDYANPEFFDSVRKNKTRLPFPYFIHTSRRHTPEHPRFRMVILLAEPVSNDHYPAVSRIIARQIDPEMAHVDAVSFRPAQMMFKPTASKDSEYVYQYHAGVPLDWQTELYAFEQSEADWRIVTNLPSVPGERLRQTAERAEDPTEKDGPVGDFCRAYDVPSAIEHFELPYTPVDAPSAKPRYTYEGGTTVNGAELQDGGLFLYSHHGSDPCSDMLVNAFDLVRIHKFGHLDKTLPDDVDGPAKYPSWKAMLKFIDEDPRYQKERVRRSYDLAAMFDDIEIEAQDEIDEATEDAAAHAMAGTPEQEYPSNSYFALNTHGYPYLRKPRPRRPKPDSDWTTMLDLSNTGLLKSNLANVAKIFTHDMRFRDSVAFNEFTQNIVLVNQIPHTIEHLPQFKLDATRSVSGEPWSDDIDALYRAILESPAGPGKSGWGFSTVTDRDLKDAKRLAAQMNKFHPIREALESFKRVGEARAEQLFIRYLGCPDTPYYRETARLWMIAAVARVYEPGCKFDFVPVLVGPQGAGKSSFAKTLALGFFGELTADFGNDQKLMEQMRAKWIIEIAELTSMARSAVETVKQFLSATDTTVRPAYGRSPVTYHRQNVFIGTTNNIDFLKDHTGGRRFWPIIMGEGAKIDLAGLRRDLEGLWADALGMYRAMREKHPEGELPLYLQCPDAAEDALHLQEESRRTDDFDMASELIYPILEAKVVDDHFDGIESGRAPKAERRMAWSVGQIRDALGNDHRITVQHIAAALLKCGWTKIGKRRIHGSTPMSFYGPTEATLARWAAEDRADGTDAGADDLDPDVENMV